MLRASRDAQWHRRYFIVDGETLSVAKDAPSAVERAVQGGNRVMRRHFNVRSLEASGRKPKASTLRVRPEG